MAKRERSTAALLVAVCSLLQLSISPGAETITYGYDALGRLISVNGSGSVNNGTQTTYGYDAAGNRTSASVVTPGSACSGVAFSINDDAETEGTPLVFTVTKSGTASGTCSVNFASANGTAVSPNDYGAVSGVLAFATSQSTLTISVNTVVAGPNELTEFMYVNLSNPTAGSTLSDGQGRGTIYNYLPGCLTCRSLPPGP